MGSWLTNGTPSIKAGSTSPCQWIEVGSFSWFTTSTLNPDDVCGSKPLTPPSYSIASTFAGFPNTDSDTSRTYKRIGRPLPSSARIVGTPRPSKRQCRKKTGARARGYFIGASQAKQCHLDYRDQSLFARKMI